MQIGMFDHRQRWIFHFLMTHEWLDKYNPHWLSVSGYHDLTPKNKSYEEVSQWNGKEMKENRQYLLGVVTKSLRGGSPAQRLIFNRTIECIWASLQFYMYARCRSNDDATLSYMEDAMHRFHSIKDVFLLGRASKQAKVNAKAQRMKLLKKRKVDKATNAETWTSSKKRREMNTWWDYFSDKIDVSMELNADFNFPKSHLMLHWTAQIHRYDALQEYFAERHELAHKTTIKDGWNASNHNLNYLP
jgi:hypothetical protein